MEIANLSGSTISERYQLVELLGAGGSGSTYRAIRLEDGATVAIKILSLRHLNDWKQLELFEREAKVLAQLSHPQIPQYLEYFHVDTPSNRAFYIVQQLAPGKPLTAWVQSGWRSTEAEVRDLASQLLGILKYLHQQSPPLIHRDLKPHNIIRNDDGRIFLVDFGAVQNVYHNTLLKGSTVAGTYGYMAPEQFRGAAVPASDLYGLGATILYLLTHRSPADLPQARLKLNFRSHVNISNHFADWLEMMLEPDTADRFLSADTAVSAIQKPHRFRTQRDTKIGFPWKSAATATAILLIAVPFMHQYRYAFLTTVGLQPRDLCNAIQKNDIRSLDRYLSQGVSIDANVVIRDGDDIDSTLVTGSLLNCAIEHGRVEIVEYLLKNGANPHQMDSGGFTPLHQAINYSCWLEDKSCQNSGVQIVRHLLNYKAHIDIKNRNGRSPLMYAVEKLNLVIFNELIKNGANLHLVDRRRLSLWHILSEYKHNYKQNKSIIRSIADRLRSAKVDINKPNDEGDTPLHLTSESNSLLTVELLLDANASINLKNNRSETPLINAIVARNFDSVKLLVSRGAGIDVPDKDGKTPLMLAIATANVGDIFTPQTFNSRLIPLLDKTKSSPKIIKLLLDPPSEGLRQRGANPNLVDRDGNTAAHMLYKLVKTESIPNGCYQQRSLAIYILDLLMRRKINRQAVNQEGDTALHLLAKLDFFPVTDRMIDYGWNPLQKNGGGKKFHELITRSPSRYFKCKSLGDR
jgi:serine/threonine protein kinase